MTTPFRADDDEAHVPGLLTSAALERLGFGPSDIARKERTGELRRIRAGVYAVSAMSGAGDPAVSTDEAFLPPGIRPLEAEFRQRIDAYLLDPRGSKSRAPLAGAAAALLWGLPLTFTPPEEVPLARDNSSGQKARGLTKPSGRVPPWQITTLNGIQVTSAARTTLDIARWHGLEAGVAAADVALRRQLVEPADFIKVLGSLTGFGGVERARSCARLADPRSESPGESISRVALSQFGVPAPELQAPLRGASGRRYRVDFCWRPAWALGEFDGRVKYRPELTGVDASETLWAEKLREDDLRRAGYLVLRWTWADLFDRRDQWLWGLKRALVTRLRQPG